MGSAARKVAASLLRRRRQELHAHIAVQLEARFPDSGVACPSPFIALAQRRSSNSSCSSRPTNAVRTLVASVIEFVVFF